VIRTRYRSLILLICAALLVGALGARAALAQEPVAVPPFDAQAVDAYLRSQMDNSRLSGMAVAVVRDGQVVYSQGYGSAAPGRAMTPQTQLYLGSLTNSFTALAALQLVEQGKLDLDAPVQQYLPWFRVADETASAQITVRHLLNQTSGLSASGDPAPGDYAESLESEVRDLAEVRPTSPVGSRFRYYNQNYRVVGLLIEQASGQPYAQYLAEHITQPLGMAHTVADPAAAPDLALGYGQAFGFAFPRGQAYHASALPSDYVISTAEDMAHYLLAMLNQGRASDQQLLKPETFALLHTPPADVRSSYGMGWVSSRAFGSYRGFPQTPVIYHSGDLESFHAMAMLFPELDLGFVILTNENSLPLKMAAHQTIAVGLASVLVGDDPPEPTPMFWVYLGLGLVATLDLLNAVRRLAQFKKWADKVAWLPSWRRWLSALMGLAIPIAVLAGLPALLGTVLAGPTSWGEMFAQLPDATAWLWVSIALNLAMGVRQVLTLAKRPVSS